MSGRIKESDRAKHPRVVDAKDGYALIVDYGQRRVIDDTGLVALDDDSIRAKRCSSSLIRSVI